MLELIVYSCSLAIPDGGGTLTMVRVPVLGVAVAITHRCGHQMVLSSCDDFDIGVSSEREVVRI